MAEGRDKNHGTVLRICPLLNMNYEGKLIPREKIRTKERVIRQIVDKMEQNAVGGLSYSGKCFISHSACPKDAQAVADLVAARFKHLAAPIKINNIGTIIGSHSGPGTVALFFWGGRRCD
jgi:fatty acid-binding protein DegV